MPARARRSTDHPSMRRAVEADRARPRRREAGDHVEQRGLAGTVRADEPDDLARLDPEADGVEGDDTAEGDRDVLDLEGGGASAGPRRSRPASERGRGTWNGSVNRWAARAQRDAVPSGAWRSRVTAPNAGQDGQPGDDVGALGHDLLEERGARARPARRRRRPRRPTPRRSRRRRCTGSSSTEPKTLYWPNCTLAWRNDSRTPPSAAIAGGHGEGVHLGRDHADPERGGGPLVAAHGEQARCRPGRAAGWPRGGRPRRAPGARSRRSAAGARAGRGRCRRR